MTSDNDKVITAARNMSRTIEMFEIDEEMVAEVLADAGFYEWLDKQ